MGHACCVLTFEPSDTKEKIRSECDDWANANVDHGEVGWGYCGLDRIKWTDLVFDNEKLARDLVVMMKLRSDSVNMLILSLQRDMKLLRNAFLLQGHGFANSKKHRIIWVLL